jgi:hypothetical protein
VSASKLVQEHVNALLAQARAQGVDDDAVARALIDRAIGIYKVTRSVADIGAELAFVADHLEDDETFPFMRP